MKKILFIITIFAINQINDQLKASSFLQEIGKSKDDLADTITKLKNSIISDLGDTRDDLIGKSNAALKVFEKYETTKLFEDQVKTIKASVTSPPLQKDLIKIKRDKIEEEMRKFAKDQLSQDSQRAQEMAKANKEGAQKIHVELKPINQQINDVLKDISTRAAQESVNATDPKEKAAFQSIHDTAVQTSKAIHDISVAAAKEIHDAAVGNAKALTANNISVAKNLSGRFAKALKALNDKYNDIIANL